MTRLVFRFRLGDLRGLPRRWQAAGELLKRQERLDVIALEQTAQAEDLTEWTLRLMSKAEQVDQHMRIADEAHDALAQWERDLKKREVRLAHPAQPPATNEKE